MRIDDDLKFMVKRLAGRLRALADRYLFFNQLGPGLETYRDVRDYLRNRRFKRDQPVDWDLDVTRIYAEEPRSIWLRQRQGTPEHIGQALLFDTSDADDDRQIAIELETARPQPVYELHDALDFYRTQATRQDKMFFDGGLAGVCDWDAGKRRLTFRRSTYFQYLQTNMALDFPVPVGDTLRMQSLRGKRLEPLRESRLANPSGVNGLVFTRDGYMMLQQRSPHVMIRARELCSGFSGTLNGSDIVHALQKQGTLADIDACRELREEMGVHYEDIAQTRLLGATREMVRGGMTELFYAVDLTLTRDEVLQRTPKDWKEGALKAVYLGPVARCAPTASAETPFTPAAFWDLLDRVGNAADGVLSLPLRTNLALWYRTFHPQIMGVGRPVDVDDSAAES